MSVEANARVTVLDQSHICCVLFQHRLFFVMHKGNGLSVYLVPFTLSCCTCITFADKLFRGVESHEKSRRAGMNEGHRGRKTVRQRNDRRHFPQTAPWKAPQHADRRSGVSHDTACPIVPPLLNFYWIWNVKGRGTFALSFLPVFFLPHYLSVVEYVAQWEHSPRQLMQTRLISWC